jgi:uncharacterized protein (TIGR02466 family)
MIENIFPLKIYKVSLGDTSSLLSMIEVYLNAAYEKTTSNNQGSMRNDGLCSYNASRELHTNSAFSSIASIIETHASIYWKELGYNYNPYIFEMWTNKYPPGSFIDVHNHAPIPLTVSFYLKKENNAGNLVFEHPLETLLKHQPIQALKDRDAYHTLFDHEVQVTTGDLVIFPGWVRHKTQVNSSDSDRIIIGANINYRA